MNAKMTPMHNPFFIDMEDDLLEGNAMKFHSEIFQVDPLDLSGGNSKYEALMEKLINPAEANFALSMYTSTPVSKSWNKDGTLSIHVEYVEFIYNKQTAVKAEIDGTVDGISRISEGGYTITLDGHPHTIPDGMPLVVSIGDYVEMGQPLAGSLTPEADNRAY